MAQQRSTHMTGRGANDLVAFAPTIWWSTVAAYQRELLEFMSHLLEKDGDTMREAVTCRNLGDALAVQIRWMDEALRDYSTEATRLLDIYARAGDRSEGPARRS